MDKEQFLRKWRENATPNFDADLDAVIANEIEKAKEQPELNEIELAYEEGKKIRRKDWNINSYTRKYDLSTKKQFTWHGERINPEEWELYHEPELAPAEQPSSQAILDNSFDRERFEAMFRAVVANGDVESTKFFECTKDLINQLDAYYAEKEKGGENG